MYERAWPRWLWSYVVGPQTYILTTPGVRGENGSFLLERVLYNRRTMVAANAPTGTALLRPWPAPAGTRSIPLRAASPATKLICRAPMCTTARADRSAEDRRLRKAEAVGSNPTRSTLRGRVLGAFGRNQARRTPHFAQKASSASTGASHDGQPYSIGAPQRPQNRSAGRKGAPHAGHAPSAEAAAAFPAQSKHRMTYPLGRRNGFHRAVRVPQSAHRRSREAPASTISTSGRSVGGIGGGGGDGSPSGGTATAGGIDASP